MTNITPLHFLSPISLSSLPKVRSYYSLKPFFHLKLFFYLNVKFFSSKSKFTLGLYFSAILDNNQMTFTYSKIVNRNEYWIQYQMLGLLVDF